MPLWTVYHPADSFTGEDKKAIAASVITLYPMLPKFYVGIIFHETQSLYVGGVLADRFVRISVDHIARQFADDGAISRWLTGAARIFKPYTEDRGFDWEIHVDETPFRLWLINGLRPPAPDSPGEKLWVSGNKAVPYE